MKMTSKNGMGAMRQVTMAMVAKNGMMGNETRCNGDDC